MVRSHWKNWSYEMSDEDIKSYNRRCKLCDLEIEMSNRSGNWLPYSITTGDLHDCPNRRDKKV
jgi:hypothetical protein